MAKTHHMEVSTSKITIEAQPGQAAQASTLGATSHSSITVSGRTTVTQATSATTAVTSNGAAGTITTVAQNIAAGAEVSFTVNCSACAAIDTPNVAIASGQTGSTTTIAAVTAVAAGSFVITLTNLDGAAAQTGTLVINYAILKASA